MSKKNACCQAEITQPIGILVSLSLSLSLYDKKFMPPKPMFSVHLSLG